MNEAKHTPIPWTLEEDATVSPDAIVYRLFGPGRRHIGTLGVGTEVRRKQTADWLPSEEARANAIAMLATPVLIEACRAALDLLDQPVRDEDRVFPLAERLALIGGTHARRLLAEALSQATGGRP